MARVAQAPLDNTGQAWAKRIDTLLSAGVKPQQIQRLKPLVQADVKTVAQGGQPMANDAALLSSIAAIKRAPVLNKNAPKTGLLDIPGNVVGDIQSLTSGAVPSLARFVWNLPKETQETAEVFSKGTSPKDQAWLKAHGYEPNSPISDIGDPSAWASAIRNVAKVPLTGIIPGVHTVANLTTAKGREQIETHPVSTALDVLPVAVAGSEALARTGALGDVTEEGSAAEAASQGKPLKATYRGVVPEGARNAIGEKTTSLLNAAGLGPDSFRLARGYAQASREAGAKYKAWLEESGVSGLNDQLAKMPREELDQLYHEATHLKEGGSVSAVPTIEHVTQEDGSVQRVVNETKTTQISPEHRAILEHVRRIGADLADVDQGLARIKYDGKEYIYPNGEVANAHRALVRESERAANVEATSNDAIEARTTRVTEKLTGKLEKAKGLLARDTDRLEAVRERITQAQERAGKSDRSVPKLQRELDLHERKLQLVKARQATVDDLQSQLDNVGEHPSIQYHTDKIAEAKAKVAARQAKFDDVFAKTPPAAFEPMLKELARQRGMERINFKFADNPDTLDAAVRDVEKRGDFYGYLDRGELDDIRKEVNSTWQELAQAGHTPIWVHNVAPGEVDSALSVRPLPTKESGISQLKTRVFDQSPRVTDIGVSMSAAQAEYLKALQTRQFIEDHLLQDPNSGIIDPHKARTWGEIRGELHEQVDLMRAKGEIPRGVDEQGALQMALQKHYTEFDPSNPFGTTTHPKLSAQVTTDNSKLYLPNEVYKAAEDLTKPASNTLFARTLRKGTAAYKYSIMALSLKHVAHVMFGGTAFLLGRGGVDELFNVKNAIDMVREGRMPNELSHDLDTLTADQLQQTATGGTLGRLWNAAGPGKAVERIYRFENFVTNVQRSLAYLSEDARGLRQGMTDEAAHEAGLQHAYKTLVDLDGMAPIERQLIRSVFPFYAFMRHTLRYALTYPIDFPLRAAILNNVNNIEQKDWSTGLPTQFQTLFFMGNPDAQGNITGVEMKQFNPLRDTGSYFTLQGFIQAVNPAIGVPFTLAGVNKFTGSPDLYPEVTVDPKTGNLVAKRPPNPALNALESVVPETGLLDYFGGLTKDMRELKARDPEAYKQRLWSMLFLPFEPKKVNLGAEASHLQANIIRVAQQDVSDALKSGDTSKLKGYRVVPYNGQLVPVEYLTNLIKLFKSHFPGVSPKASIPSNL